MSEIQIFGEIGTEVTAADIKASLAAADRGEELVVRIDSPGGSVFEGFAIYDALDAYDGPKRCVIESAAFSIAAMFPLAFERVEITQNGYVMIHDPRVGLMDATLEDLQSQADMMAKIRANYVSAMASRMGKSEEEIADAMSRETYYNANEAVSAGIATSIAQRRTMSLVAKYRVPNLPMAVASALVTTETKPSEGEAMPQPASIQEIREAFPKAKADFILQCVEKELPMASVAAAAAQELMTENEQLKSEVEELRAKLAEYDKYELVEESDDPAMEDMEDDDEEMEPMPEMRGGAKPVARASKSTLSGTAKKRWDEAIAKYLAEGHDRPKAVVLANRENPGLRQEMLSEVAG